MSKPLLARMDYAETRALVGELATAKRAHRPTRALISKLTAERHAQLRRELGGVRRKRAVVRSYRP